MDLTNSMSISAAGMKAQGARIRTISENIANAKSTGTAPGEDPYRRKTITFKSALNRDLGVHLVEAGRISVDRSPFKQVHMPNHPMANDAGYVKMPNVNTLVEMANLREAQRSYEANVSVIENARAMLMRTVDLLRA
ncbi:MAG: flagellar basal body rod protein FlgC [Thalassobaculaceae bacterium]